MPRDKSIRWDCSRHDAELIRKISRRMLEFYPEASQVDCVMDLTACHCNGCPLDLERLLKAPDFDFLHDLNGIRNHLNRATGKLTNCFSPRYSKP